VKEKISPNIRNPHYLSNKLESKEEEIKGHNIENKEGLENEDDNFEAYDRLFRESAKERARKFYIN
jgi:hypothetical protein